MKGFLITTGVLAGAFIASQIFSTVNTNKTERQPYEVLRKEKDFEIRHYPSATMATISSKANTYKELSSPGFSKLAGYIFGGNEGNQSIAMTSPVHMTIDDSMSSMSFVMPAGYTLENLPKPKNAEVKLETVAEEYVAASTFGGYVSDGDLEKYAQQLSAALQKASIQTEGNFRLLGYNPPFQVIGRTNEVIVKVNWRP